MSYLIQGNLPEQNYFKCLTRIPVYMFGGMEFNPVRHQWEQLYNTPISFKQAEDYAKQSKIEIGPTCFYLPINTIVYVPKKCNSCHHKLIGYKKHNIHLGIPAFSAYIYYENCEVCEFEDFSV